MPSRGNLGGRDESRQPQDWDAPGDQAEPSMEATCVLVLALVDGLCNVMLTCSVEDAMGRVLGDGAVEPGWASLPTLDGETWFRSAMIMSVRPSTQRDQLDFEVSQQQGQIPPSGESGRLSEEQARAILRICGFESTGTVEGLKWSNPAFLAGKLLSLDEAFAALKLIVTPGGES